MTTTEQLEARIRVLENDIAAWHAAARDVMGTSGDVGPNALRRWRTAKHPDEPEQCPIRQPDVERLARLERHLRTMADGTVGAAKEVWLYCAELMAAEVRAMRAPPSAGKARVDVEVTVNGVNPDRWCADLAAKLEAAKGQVAIGQAWDIDPPGGPEPAPQAAATRRPTLADAARDFGQACRDAGGCGEASVEISGQARTGALAGLTVGRRGLTRMAREERLPAGSVLTLVWRF